MLLSKRHSPFRAQQTKDLAMADREAQVVDGTELTEALREIVYFDIEHISLG